MALPEPVFLRDDHGNKVCIGRTQDDDPFISITEGVVCVMAVLSGERLAAVTEALDRMAMPGQVTVKHGPGCPCTPCTVYDAAVREERLDAADIAADRRDRLDID